MPFRPSGPYPWSSGLGRLGQYHCILLYKQTGQHALITPSVSHHQPFGMVLCSSYLSSRCIFGRREQFHSRSSQQTTVLPSRAGSRQCHLSPPLSVLGTPDIDVFTSWMNKKWTMFCSQAGISCNSLGYAFLMNCSRGHLYMFPLSPYFKGCCSNSTRECKRHTYTPVVTSPTLFLDPAGYIRLQLVPHLLSRGRAQVFHPDLESLHLTAWRLPRL